MQVKHKEISPKNPTLNQLIAELGEECQNVLTLVNQFQLSKLSDEQKAEILSELLAASIHLHTHCDQDFQSLISNEIEDLPSED